MSRPIALNILIFLLLVFLRGLTHRRWASQLCGFRSVDSVDDNHQIMHTHHAWPSQMHTHLLINAMKTRAIVF